MRSSSAPWPVIRAQRRCDEHTAAVGKPRHQRQPGKTGRLRLTGLVARREYLRTVRRRGFIFGTLLLPFGIAFLMGISVFFSTDGFSGDQAASGTIVVVERLGHRPHACPASGAVNLTTLSEQEAASQLHDGTISDYYLILRASMAPARSLVSRAASGVDLSRLDAQNAQRDAGPLPHPRCAAAPGRGFRPTTPRASSRASPSRPCPRRATRSR